MILSPSKQEQVETIIERVAEIGTLAADRDGLDRIREMVPSLTAEARKVLRTYQRLSTTLRRLLDRDLRTERARLAMVLGELRALAVQIADEPQRSQAATFSLELEAEISLPTERPFWSPPGEFAAIELKTHTADDVDRAQAFTDLALLRSLDWRRLRRQIELALVQQGEVSLAELLSFEEPDRNGAHMTGAVEVMGLIQIAHEDGHLVDGSVMHEIQVRHADGTSAALEIPKVVFSRNPTQRLGQMAPGGVFT